VLLVRTIATDVVKPEVKACLLKKNAGKRRQ
jgi:hypothetical protein